MKIGFTNSNAIKYYKTQSWKCHIYLWLQLTISKYF